MAATTSAAKVRLNTFRGRPGRRRPRRATTTFAGASSSSPNPDAPCTATIHRAGLDDPAPNAATPLTVATTRSVNSVKLSGRMLT